MNKGDDCASWRYLQQCQISVHTVASSIGPRRGLKNITLEQVDRADIFNCSAAYVAADACRRCSDLLDIALRHWLPIAGLARIRLRAEALVVRGRAWGRAGRRNRPIGQHGNDRPVRRRRRRRRCAVHDDRGANVRLRAASLVPARIVKAAEVVAPGGVRELVAERIIPGVPEVRRRRPERQRLKRLQRDGGIDGGSSNSNMLRPTVWSHQQLTIARAQRQEALRNPRMGRRRPSQRLHCPTAARRVGTRGLATDSWSRRPAPPCPNVPTSPPS